MGTLCGADCSICQMKEQCKGCECTGGRPFGGTCVAAECIKAGGKEAFWKYKQKAIAEINALGVEGMPQVTELYCLAGSYVNLAYPLENGATVQLLDESKIYLGCQVEAISDGSQKDDRCFGVVIDETIVIVCKYGENGSNPELVLYKVRQR